MKTYIDSTQYTGLKVIDIVYGLDDKVKTQDIHGKIKLYKIYYTAKGRAYFNKYKRRMFLDEFLAV